MCCMWTGGMKSWWFIKENVWIIELGVAGYMKSKEGKGGNCGFFLLNLL
jgi:hypothetical protein